MTEEEIDYGKPYAQKNIGVAALLACIVLMLVAVAAYLGYTVIEIALRLPIVGCVGVLAFWLAAFAYLWREIR
jgi:hypothetical protein